MPACLRLTLCLRLIRIAGCHPKSFAGGPADEGAPADGDESQSDPENDDFAVEFDVDSSPLRAFQPACRYDPTLMIADPADLRVQFEWEEEGTTWHAPDGRALGTMRYMTSDSSIVSVVCKVHGGRHRCGGL